MNATRDKTHMEFVENWAKKFRESPAECKKIQNEFINALFEKNANFLKRLAAQPGGPEKIIRLYRIKNVKAYEELLGIENP